MEPMKAKKESVNEGVKSVSGPVVQIDENRIHAHLDEVLRSTVEETLNALLDAEATDSAELGSTNAARAARIRGPVVMTASSAPKLAKSC